ncbi:MAG: hypothetical protein U9Q68_03480 [Euryarchaeota archaeon]|nr:hypothetical protein [Euryarchaeota archaeon]
MRLVTFFDFSGVCSQGGYMYDGFLFNYMKRGELHHDLCTILFSTDYAVMTSKYHEKIPVGDNRRGTEIIRKTCEEVNIGTQELYVWDDESLRT